MVSLNPFATIAYWIWEVEFLDSNVHREKHAEDYVAYPIIKTQLCVLLWIKFLQ